MWKSLEIKSNSGSTISLDISIFEIDRERGMVNLTKIAKACGKNLGDWFKTENTTPVVELYNIRYAKNHNEQNQALMTVIGGNKSGTWANRDVAIKFAMWISPSFEVWCTRKLDELFQNGTASLSLPRTYKEALLALVDAEEEKERLVAITKQQTKELEYKEDVIVGLVKDISFAEKRQRLNQIMRHNVTDSSSMQDRWILLYSEFERKFHIDIGRRMKNATTIKPKIKNKLDYVDRVLGLIPDIYELACKVFDGDIEDLKREWFEVVG